MKNVWLYRNRGLFARSSRSLSQAVPNFDFKVKAQPSSSRDFDPSLPWIRDMGPQLDCDPEPPLGRDPEDGELQIEVDESEDVEEEEEEAEDDGNRLESRIGESGLNFF